VAAVPGFHPWHTTKLLWTWEWHALVVWAVFAVVAMPLVAMASEPVLRKMAARVRQRNAGGV